MFILNVIMLGGYGIIQKTGLEQYITLTLKFQTGKIILVALIPRGV